MIFEVLPIYFLVKCINMIVRVIARRQDVLHYVSKPNPG